MTLLYIFVAAVLLITAIMVILTVASTKDSAGRKNNALLMYYFAVAIWGATAIGGITSNTQVAMKMRETKVSSKTSGKKTRVIRSGKRTVSGPDWGPLFNFVFYGMAIHAIVYVVRRPEWASLLIIGGKAIRGKSVDTAVDSLVHHGIYNEDDREWVQDTLRILKGTEKPEEEEEPVIINPDLGGFSGH